MNIVQTITAGDYSTFVDDIDTAPAAAAAFYRAPGERAQNTTNAPAARGVVFHSHEFVIESDDIESWEGDATHDTEIMLGATPAAVVAVIRSLGLTFDSTGNDWAAEPDGSHTVDYGTGRQRTVTAHPFGYSTAVLDVIMAAVDA